MEEHVKLLSAAFTQNSECFPLITIWATFTVQGAQTQLLSQHPIQNQHCFWALKWRMHRGSTCKNTVMDSLLYQSQSPGLSLQGESSMLKSGKYSYHRQCASSNLWFSWELCNHWNMFQGDQGPWPTSNMVQTICRTSFQEVARPMHLQLLLPIGIRR